MSSSALSVKGGTPRCFDYHEREKRNYLGKIPKRTRERRGWERWDLHDVLKSTRRSLFTLKRSKKIRTHQNLDTMYICWVSLKKGENKRREKMMAFQS